LKTHWYKELLTKIKKLRYQKKVASFFCLQLSLKAFTLGALSLLTNKINCMKRLKKTKAKLHPDEVIVGKGVPDRMLNQEKIKKLGKTKSRTKAKRKK
jgi:hypothetical protein